jgi:alpha-galactosidase
MTIRAVVLAALLCGVAVAQTNPSTQTATAPVSTIAPTLAQTPPMGWNSWNHFARRVNEQDVKDAADAMVKSGMRDAGYIYVNIDDTWEGQRDASGMLSANAKFPDMKALGDYIHARGLKFGIYSSPGPQTCARFPGSYGHEQQDADLYASWGVDYLKYDLCSFGTLMQAAVIDHPDHPDTGNEMMKAAYAKMRRALDHTGRPIVLSLCQYGDDDVWTWGASVGGNLWRTTGDINDTYARMATIGFGQAGLARYAGPGHWNDPDMLEVGNGGMTADEYRTHMSLWAILAAPLLAGNDLSRMSDETRSILMNKAVLAVDQDRLGRQGDRISKEGDLEVWSKPLADGAVAVGLFNRGAAAAPMTLKLSSVSPLDHPRITNVWTGANVKPGDGAVTATIPTHGVLLLRLSR